MKKHKILSLVLAIGMSSTTMATDIAIVNGVPVTEDDFNAYSKARARQMGNPNVNREDVVNELVSRELMVQNVVKKEYDKSPEFIKKFNALKYSFMAQYSLSHYLKANPITDEALQAEYNKRIADIKPEKEYKARHILVKTEDEAKAMIVEIGKGADFAKLAKEKSTDKGSGSNGGDLGWFTKDRMVKPFSDAVMLMKKGKHSSKAVKSQFGWHVILLEDSRDVKPPAFEDVKPSFLKNMRAQAMMKHIKELREKAEVKIIEPPKNTKETPKDKK
jgi:peptidyl-prolyl cis-trans isomerase C